MSDKKISVSRITRDILKSWGACEVGREWFAINYPNGAEYVEAQIALHKDGRRDWSNWLSWRAIENLGADAVALECAFSDALIAEMLAADDGAPEDASSLSASWYASRLSASGYVSRLSASGHDSSLAASGHASRLAASGYASRLSASGHDSSLAASGHDSSLAASGYASSLAASGHDSSLAASGYASRLAASGYASVIACSGLRSTFCLGENGCAAIAYHDGTRVRFAVAYVGENVQAGRTYRVTDAGEFVEVV